MSAIRNFLDVSTGHLKVQTRQWLDENASPAITDRSYSGPDVVPLWYAPTASGYFMHIGDVTLVPAGLPEQHRYLMAVLTHARDLGCSYVLFDADAPVDPALATFDDEVAVVVA